MAVGGNKGGNYYGGLVVVVGLGMGGVIFVYSGISNMVDNIYDGNMVDMDFGVHVF